jgi:hypothetical protein
MSNSRLSSVRLQLKKLIFNSCVELFLKSKAFRIGIFLKFETHKFGISGKALFPNASYHEIIFIKDYKL